MRLLLFLLCIFSMASALAQPREFIIDTDVGIDDVIAISYFLQHQNIDIKAITVECDGDAYCTPAYTNTKKLLNLFHRDIPLAAGRETWLGAGHVFPTNLKSMWNDFGAGLFLDGKIEPGKVDAKSLMITTLSKSPTPIEILALGPLTTVAEVIQAHPELKAKIRMIYLMGGAVHVPGNIIDTDPSSDNHAAEWNIYFDPLAADMVFRSGVPLTLVPLDVTNKIVMDKKFFSDIKARSTSSAAAKFLYHLMDQNQKLLFSGLWYFWDPLAAVVATDEKIADVQTLPLRIELTEGPNLGATVVDKEHGNNIRVCLQIDAKQFKRQFLSVLSSRANQIH